MSKIDALPSGIARFTSYLDCQARQMLLGRLTGLGGGEIVVADHVAQTLLGDPADLRVEVRVHRPRFFRQALLGGTLSVAESYIDGDWDCDDLTSLFRILVRNVEATQRLDRGPAKFVGLMHRMYHAFSSNSRAGSRRNIQAHYDLGNDFFRLWLDETMAYSSAVFTTPEVTLKEASTEKFDRICRKLELQAEDHVLEIGCGWGGFALHAAETYDCRVTATTISREQYRAARRRIVAAGLEDRIELLDRDYRDLSGSFDKLVSIEMIEAVGHRFLDQYFRKCSQLLRADGSLALQAIVMPEGRHRQYLRSVDFIQRYIFPGGCLPSLASMLEAAGRSTDLRLAHVEDLAPHYAETLRRWRISFHQRQDEVRQLGYPDRFIRLWTYYLSYCEALFTERHIGVLQLQFDKPRCRRDPAKISDRVARDRTSTEGQGSVPQRGADAVDSRFAASHSQ